MILKTVLGTTCAIGLYAVASAAPPPPTSVSLSLKNHIYVPASITVPAGQALRIDLINHDGTAADFESKDLNVDKEVAPHGHISFVVGPLAPGTYHFTTEQHADTASGTLIAVAPPQ